jgi:hypothetical protein
VDWQKRQLRIASAFAFALGLVMLALVSCSTVTPVSINPPKVADAHFVGNAACADCHSDYTRLFAASPHGLFHKPGKAGLGETGCELCHGPGSRHVASGGQGTDKFIVNPRKKPEIVDLKTGRMNQKSRAARLAKNETPAMKKANKKKSKFFDTNLTPNKWHQLEVKIDGDQMQVSVDGKVVGKFSSPGIGHPTKRRLRLAVNKSAWIDDVKITGW